MDPMAEGYEEGYEKAVLERMRIAFDLAETAFELKKARLRRENPDATEHELSELFVEWLHRRPGAEHGDAEGRPRTPAESP